MKLLWVFDPDAVCALAPLSGALWALGGAGPKWLRRFVLPAILTLSAISLGRPLWAAALSGTSLLVFTTLPYGDSVQNRIKWAYWPFVFLVGTLYGAAAFPLLALSKHWILAGLSGPLTGIAFAGLMLWSKKAGLAWKIVEISIGVLIGTWFAIALL